VGVTRAAAFAAVALLGCKSMAPTYERPAAPVPASLPAGAAGSASDGGRRAADMKIGELVREPRLREVLARVVADNRTLRGAASDIESARQLYRLQRAARLPEIDASANVTAAREFIGIPGAETERFTEYTAGVGLTNWEIDVFGRLKSLSDAKLQSYLAAVEAAKAMRISLIAEAATAYVTLAADRSRLAIARDTMTAAQKAMELTEQLVGGGTSNRGDYWQASTVFQQARGDVAALTAAIAQDRNALELLAGGPIEDALLPDGLPPQLDWFADVPVGLSSAVLLDRPDVLAAEHYLESANANIGAARAAFFPSLTLTANAGIVSLALAALFTGPTAVWTLAPTLTLPLFKGGANRANLAYTVAQKQSLIAAYELAIQTAFREVADALATRATIGEQLEAQVALVEAAQKSLELAQARYKAGIDPFLATLVSQRALYAAQNQLAATQLAALANRVTLYRALGGGGR
jgi:multidrug efflux system outer membrane protein